MHDLHATILHLPRRHKRQTYRLADANALTDVHGRSSGDPGVGSGRSSRSLCLFGKHGGRESHVSP